MKSEFILLLTSLVVIVLEPKSQQKCYSVHVSVFQNGIIPILIPFIQFVKIKSN
jgi:hypothetical protein